MIIFPAIDIRGGKCVRLTEGRFDQETVFSDHPAEMALRWKSEGTQYLHVVDLDGALAGQPVNLNVVEEIVRVMGDIPVQMGGGIRTIKSIEQILATGIRRVILGSVAVRNPELVKEACRRFHDGIVVGIDARDGQVAVEGWGVNGGIDAGTLAVRMAEVGVQRFVYTDISRDGMLSGVNVKATAELAQMAKIPVIASGGVRDLEDIRAVKRVEADGVEGVIIGKAIYTGCVNLTEALELSQEGNEPCTRNA